MKSLKKIQVLALALIVALGVAVLPNTVSAATPKLSKTKVTLTVGKSTTLKLNNAPKNKKVTWTTSDKKIATVSQKGKVTAKKAGKATITAKVSNKKYTCKVTVKSKSQDTQAADIKFTNEAGKNKNDVAALEAIIREQNSKNGADLPTDLDSSENYTWTNGRLTSFDFGGSEGKTMKGSLDLSGLKELQFIYVNRNELTSINVKGLTKLLNLSCSSNQLKSLDTSTNTDLLNIYCEENLLTSLRVSANAQLRELYCDNNKLTRLEVTKNKRLSCLSCKGNSLTELDVTGIKNLSYLQVDDGVNVKK